MLMHYQTVLCYDTVSGAILPQQQENHILIKMHCYLVTMVITKFLQSEFNIVIQEEFIDTKFAKFRNGLVIIFQGIIKHIKMHRFTMVVMESSFLQCWKPKPFSSISLSNSRKSSEMVLSIIVFNSHIMAKQSYIDFMNIFDKLYRQVLMCHHLS